MATSRNQSLPPVNRSVEDIDHQEVATGTQSVPAELSTEQVISMEIVKLGLADQRIAELKQQYSQLSIAGVDDKDGYKAVREAWATMQKVRTSLTKKGLAIRSQYTEITKGVKKEEDRLVALVEPLEDELHGKWKAIDAEKDRLKREEEEREQAALNARLQLLLDKGMVFEDGMYQIGATISVDVATLRAMPDAQFDKLTTAVDTKAAEIKAEKQRQAQIRQKEEDDRKAEAARLREQQDQLDRDRKELEDHRAEIEKDRQAMAKQIVDSRRARLTALGLVDAGDGYFTIKIGLGVARMDSEGYALISSAPAEMFEKTLADWKNQIDINLKEWESREEQRLMQEKERAKRLNQLNEIMKPVLQFNPFTKIWEHHEGSSSILFNPETYDGSIAEAEELAAEYREMITANREAIVREERKRKQEEEADRKRSLSDTQKFNELRERTANAILAVFAEYKFITPQFEQQKASTQRDLMDVLQWEGGLG